MVVYNGTVTGLRISSVDGGVTESGGAFVDGLPSAVTDLVAAYPGDLSFEAFDSAGRFIRGVLKAVGSGETLSLTEVNPDPGFATAAGWTAQNGWSITEGGTEKAVAVVGTGVFCYRSVSRTALALYKSTLDIDTISGGVKIVYRGTPQVGPTYNTTGSKTEYITQESAVNGAVGLYRAVPGSYTGIFDNLSSKQVLTPSTSGATIVSAKGGTTWNFSYKNASFTYNAASYYCIVKKLR